VRSQKILLCAPSNAAIDELCDRVRGVGQDAIGRKVVRIGTEQGIGLNVKDISLDHLVEQRLGSTQDPTIPLKDIGNEIHELREQIERVRRQKQIKEAELSEVHDNTARTLALGNEIKRLNSQRLALTQKFDRLKDKQKSDSRTMDATRRKLRAEILYEADIICSTLSGAAHELLEQFEFEMVVIDEAAQGK
jgi:senataxin